MFFPRIAVFLSVLTLAACAGGPGSRSQFTGAGGAADISAQAERILADARRKKAEQGCATAIPSYRVVASFGKGHDTAQSELGACLMEAAAMEGANRALLQEEGLLWLRRAAWAGNARAQVTLADALSGASPLSAGLKPDLIEGYGWALLFEDNAAHNLYGLPDLHPAAADHFRTQMNAEDTKAAQAFAAAFHQVEMDVFIPPADIGPQAEDRQGPPGGGRPRQPR